MVPNWERRFRAPVLLFPHWAREAPDRLVFSSNLSGALQLYSWDRHRHAQVTDNPMGVGYGRVSLDGSRILWFDDRSGGETGRWLAVPFEGGQATPLAPGLPEGWSAGYADSPAGTAIGVSTRGDYSLYRVTNGEAGLLASGPEPQRVEALSEDGSLLAVGHAVAGDYLHPGIRVVDFERGEVVAALADRGRSLHPAGFAPRPGDARLAFDHELSGATRPGLLDTSTGERRDIAIELEGDFETAGWFPDASALLLVRDFEGRNELYRYDLGDDRLERLDHAVGSVAGCRVRPDGEIWLRHSSGARPWTLMRLDGSPLLELGDQAPEGVPFRSWHFKNPAGGQVHGFLAEAPGAGPKPLLMRIHGGPQAHYTDSFLPEVQAWVDHGVSVAMVNYRGSTGYGQAWRDFLIGNPGFPETEDVVAGLDDLLASGAVDPARVIVGGRSWGGYITLLCAGLHPQRWAVAEATVPVADYVTAFADEGPDLQALDRNLFGGDPQSRPELYQERSPITYVEKVEAPILIVAGDNDIRCPLQQILNYVDRLEALGKPYRLYRYAAGHGSLLIEERLRQMRLELAFAAEHLPGGLAELVAT